MATGTDISKAGNLLGNAAIKSAEWMAENAYVAPGFHRLLTAGGLTSGLFSGRIAMNLFTARDGNTGEDIPRSHTLEILRPLHGIFRYNPYSDEAGDRWKSVVDHTVPVVLGAVGAYYGSRFFAHGKIPKMPVFFPMGETIEKLYKNGEMSTAIAEAMQRNYQADASRKWAAATMVQSSATGQHLSGALSPFNNGMSAMVFQQSSLRNPRFSEIAAFDKIPVLRLFNDFIRTINKTVGGFGSSSRALYPALRDTSNWMKANIIEFEKAEEWAHPELLMKRAQDGLQKFVNPTQDEIKKLADAYRELIDKGYEAARHYKDLNPLASKDEIGSYIRNELDGGKPVGKELDSSKGMGDAAHDKLLHHLGFNLSEQDFTRDGQGFFSRLFGSQPREHEVMLAYGHYLQNNFSYGRAVNSLGKEENIVGWAEQWAKEQLHMSPVKVAAAYGGGAAAITGALAGASYLGAKLHRETSHTHKPHIILPETDAQKAPTHNAAVPERERGNAIDWLNGKPLDVAQWLSRVMITPPSMHRFMNAAYLSAVLYGGVKVADLLTGRKLAKLGSSKLLVDAEGEYILNEAGKAISESVLRAEEVWEPLRPLRGLLSYTPGSAKLKDRWRQAAHYIMPVAAGMFGTYGGSHQFFADRIKELRNPETLEDYADRISLEQSRVYAGAMAVTSIFNTGSGVHLLPIVNYSSNLHNRFLMANGQQVALPGVGKWWSGNAGITPWGVKRTLAQMTHYLTYNELARPREMPTLVHSLIGKLYPKLSDSELLDKKQTMLDRIYDVRDSYLVEGVVPPTKQEALGAAMHKMLSGVGLEALLKEVNLDPAKADLAANGASGAIANFVAMHGVVNRLQNDYREQYAARTKSEKIEKPSKFLRNLVDQGPSKPTANDNTRLQTHAERVAASDKEAFALGA